MSKKNGMNLQGKSVLMIVAFNNFRDEEYFEPKSILEKAGVKVFTASTGNEATSKLGKIIKVDMMLGEITEPEQDGVIFVGGEGASIYLSMVKAHKIARSYHEKGKIVAAICLAPSILANAGLLEGKKVTADSEEEKNLVRKGAIFVKEAVVQDGNIITGNGALASKEFGEKIAEALATK
jgi:protease I